MNSSPSLRVFWEGRGSIVATDVNQEVGEAVAVGDRTGVQSDKGDQHTVRNALQIEIEQGKDEHYQHSKQ